ncbi:MAG: P-loop NTPase fold protein [Cyclobacteriaceae bacterium]|nr:P-loop NTPase fold protein [Cyclobacteriaceae bacterium]
MEFSIRLEENETCFYTAIIYDDEVRKLWDMPDSETTEDKKIEIDTKSSRQKITIAFNDSANQKIDLLGVNREIEVFARLLAQKDLSPPLAIALFGNWGSGKSFFMHNLEANIKQLSTSEILKPDGTPFYCKEIVHISFNAWSYLDANLWAGLVTSIFEKLNEYITQSTKSGVAKMKVVEKLRERLTSFQSLKISEVERKTELEILKKGYEIEQKSLEESIKSNFSENIITIINGEEELSSIYSSISKDGYLSALTEQLKLDKLQEEAEPFKSFFRNLKSIKSLYKYVLPALLGVAIAIGIWGAGQYLKLGLGALIPFITTLGIDWKILLSRYQNVKSFVLGFNKIIGQNVHLEKKVIEHKDLVKNADNQIEEAQVQIAQLDEKINDFQKYMETEINQETIKDFIQTRANHKDYLEKLGIVSIIRRDFETLSELFYESSSTEDRRANNEKDKELLRKQFKEGRTLERIILYIDDLDRCSDDKVLEVLQAVHLLMAFPLFIVVVGVDKRCVTNALYNREVSKYFQLEEYSEIKTGKKTNGIHIIQPDEYLEKIFQIPFQLQKPDPKNIQNMIHELLEEDMLHEDQTKDADKAPAQNKAPAPVSQAITGNANIAGCKSTSAGIICQ